MNLIPNANPSLRIATLSHPTLDRQDLGPEDREGLIEIADELLSGLDQSLLVVHTPIVAWKISESGTSTPIPANPVRWQFRCIVDEGSGMTFDGESEHHLTMAEWVRYCAGWIRVLA